MLVFSFFCSNAQIEQRLKIISILPGEHTGQDYTPWLNDNLNDLVASVWTPTNLKYVDIVLQLEKKSSISKVLLYDDEGIFGENPVSIFALNGPVRTFIGMFTGDSYKTFVDLHLNTPVVADALIIHKFGNNIPQKVFIYGVPSPLSSSDLYRLVPGKIEAESFSSMSGIDVEPTEDVYGGKGVGWIDTEDWMEYQLSVPTAGKYLFQFRVAVPYTAAALEVSQGGQKLSGPVMLPKTGGWQSWATVTVPLDLGAGSQTLRLSAVQGDWNFNWFEVVRPEGNTPSAPGKTQSVISFAALADKNMGDSPFQLVATSNNKETPITFKSTNTAVVSVSNASGIWQATATGAGTAYIIATQEGSVNYLPAATITRTQIVRGPITSEKKIPINPVYWYQLNNIGDATSKTTGLRQLTDGIINQAVFMGWSKLFPNYNCYYQFKNLSGVRVSRIRFYDGEGSFSDKPFQLYARASLTSEPVLLANFTGEKYAEWIDVVLPTPVLAEYLILNCWYGFPDEMELYGDFNPAPHPELAPRKVVKLKDMFGINSFVWDFMQNEVEKSEHHKVYEPKMALMQAFSQFRDYVDWGKIEPQEGVYTFDHTQDGGWNYDAMYQRLKREGKEVVACFKTVPNWFLQQSYPEDLRDNENVPAPYGSNLLNPSSYRAQARAAFQFAARYGATKVDLRLLSSVKTGVVWPTDPASPVMTVQTGLNYINYIECENERDKWWKGRKAYQTGYEYAANLSAFYDGHQGTMGTGVGVKNADPTMRVVMGGIASTETDYIRAIIDWCKEFRGYRADGTVDLCFDVINYHMYANDAQSSQNGYPTRGAAPEVSGAGDAADAFVALAREYGVEVWITETGYDINPHSPIRAIPIGTKSTLEVQADWILRTALLNARHGISRTFFYQTYDEHVDSWVQFASSGLLDNTTWKRKPAADYLFQVNKLLGAYEYKETLTFYPVVDRFELNGQAAYALVVPEEKNKTLDYILNLGNVDSARIYRPQVGSDDMKLERVALSNGKLVFTVTETPVFVLPSGGAEPLTTTQSVGSTFADMVNDIKSDEDFALKVYPNPASGWINLSFETTGSSDLEVELYDATGKLHQRFVYNKPGRLFSGRLDLSGLNDGRYFLKVNQDNIVRTETVIKLK